MLRAGSVRPGKVNRALETMERNSLAQIQLVEDLLDVSRIVSGKFRLDLQAMPLKPVVEAAIESMLHAFEAKSVSLLYEIDANAGSLAGDSHRLQQVIWNLLSNALKFTPGGGTVRLGVKRLEGGVELTVSDTGQGIPTRLLPTIFERFKQADGSIARVHGGLGLGLAIVRHIVELHGGTIEARSDGEGRGSTFVVHLPDLGLGDPAGGPLRAAGPWEYKPPFEPPKELQGLTVLVVDDEPDSREILAEVLQQCGSSVITAASADEALRVLDRASPQVMVCDVGMPGMNGYELLERVRTRPSDRNGGILALALTAYASLEDRRRALRAGFQMHLTKPVEPSEFVAGVANLAQLAIAAS